MCISHGWFFSPCDNVGLFSRNVRENVRAYDNATFFTEERIGVPGSGPLAATVE